VLHVKSVYAPHAQASNYDHDSFDDPAGWGRCSTAQTPVDVIEPQVGELNEYREASLNLLRLLLVCDAFCSRSQDARLSWVAVALVLQLDSVRNLSHAEICRRMGVSENTLSRSMTRFRAIAGLGAPDGLRALGSLRANGYHNNTA
jgi:hypothetical protein